MTAFSAAALRALLDLCDALEYADAHGEALYRQYLAERDVNVSTLARALEAEDRIAAALGYYAESGACVCGPVSRVLTK